MLDGLQNSSWQYIQINEFILKGFLTFELKETLQRPPSPEH